MGLFFHSSSWRKPLQLIDCWLPEPRAEQAERRAHAGTRLAAPTAAMRRFARAGWLGQSREASAARPRRGADGRVALAGRIDEVCRELDRLAELDRRCSGGRGMASIRSASA